MIFFPVSLSGTLLMYNDSICAKVFEGEVVMLSRPKKQNLVMVSEAEYNFLEKARRNLDYLNMLDESDRQLASGKVVEKSMEELESMAVE